MTNRNLLSKKIILGLATATLCYGPFGVGYAEVAENALPTKGNVSYGDATISESESTHTMNVFQTSDKAIIDWGSFNVGKNATVNFIQTKDNLPNVAAMTLNRVNAAGGMSEIAGHINSIGSFILVNPNGTMFYEGSTVNAAGVIVSTAEIDEEKFKSGQLYFKQTNTSNANITVNGSINASTNGTYLEGADGLLAKVKADLEESPLNLDGIKLATGFSFANNTIKLVADGDIVVGNTGSLQAVTSTTISGDKTVGTEEFSVEGDSSTRLGSITLRADQNADDVAVYDNKVLETAGIDSNTVTTYDNGKLKTAKVYLNNAKDSQIASHSIGIYYNPDITETGINGAQVANIKDVDENQVVALSDANVKYTQKNYKNTENYGSKVADTFTQFSRVTEGENKGKPVETANTKIVSESYNMLVNNLYQMEAIQDKTYGNMNGSYAQGTNFDAKDTANWNSGKGFKPISTETKTETSTETTPFTGSFTGHGGSNTYSITDLTINRPSEDNVGLFGMAKDASFWSINLVDSNIFGKNNVGGIAGQAIEKSILSGISVSKDSNITGTDNVGGIVGEMKDSTIRYSSNGATVSGQNNVGGLAGSVSGGAFSDELKSSKEGYTNNIYKSSNSGFINSIGTSAGGLVGRVNSTLNTKDEQFATGDNNSTKNTTTNTTDTTEKLIAVAITDSYSNGKVSGKTDVGGIVGTLEKGTIQYTYNTNENAALSSSSVVGEASVGAGTSEYGRVYGTTNVGGIVGNMTGGAIDQSYNASNIKGETSVGGVVGSMSGGTINKAYNADNNTVLKTSKNEAEYYGFTVKNGDKIDSYTYDQNVQKWYKNGDKTNDVSNSLPAETERTYYNRLAYRDATVNGTKNVGGIVGTMSNGTINEVYNAGQVNGKEGAPTTPNIGAFVGEYKAGTINSSFYVTTENDGTEITKQTNAVGNGVAVSGITGKKLNEAQNNSSVGWTGDKNTANGWTIYTNSSTPLLNHFMKWININRQYEYDGTVHNLMTTDVANYYGGAFFDNGDGKNVYSKNYGLVKDVITGGYKASDWVIKSGSASADTSHSSVYTYDNSTMWSPQHGYYTHDDARMIITPKTVTATITGTKTYGEDPVVGVKAADGTETNVTEAHSSNYTMTFADGAFIGKDTADSVFNIDRSGTKYNKDTNQWGAGTYTTVADFTNPTFERKNKNYNYNVTFEDTLTVKKADLVVNIVGTKMYGNDISSGSYKYYAKEQNTEASDDKFNNGKLKSWETTLTSEKEAKAMSVKDKVIYAESKEDVKHNNVVITGTEKPRAINNLSDVIGDYDADGNFNQKAYDLKVMEIEGLDNSTKQLANTLENNYNLIFDINNVDTNKRSTAQVTVTPRPINMVVEGEKVYGQNPLKGGVTEGDVKSAGEKGHYFVKIDGYVNGDNPALDTDLQTITYSKDSNQLGAGVYTDTTDTEAHFVNPVVTNNSFSETDTTINHNYTGKVTNKLTVKKADLYINVNGSKQYGDGIKGDTASYTYSATKQNKANADHTATEKDKENDGSLKSWDTLSSTNIDKKYINGLVANDDVYHNTELQTSRNIDEKSNVITNSNGYGLDKVDFAAGAFIDLTNYNVIFDTSKGSKGTMKITPAALTVTSIGTKTYGDAAVKNGVLGNTTEAGKYNVTVDGLKAGDTVADSFTYNFNNVKNGADNEKLAAGTYENSANFTNPVFTAKDSNKPNYNYSISYVNKLTVNPAPIPDPTTPTDPAPVTPEPTPTTDPTPVTPVTPRSEEIVTPINKITAEKIKEVSEEIHEVAEDTKTGAAEESKKIRYGGYIPKDARDGIRFITVEETGINVEEARVENTTITIAPDSLVEGSTEVVINGDAETSAE